ncbi:MAG: hypothetical protein ACYDBB_24485 [Armatimonadota bacterium]
MQLLIGYMLLTLVVGSAIKAGFINTALKQLRQQRTSVGDLFTGVGFFLPMVVLDIATMIFAMAGFLLCCVGVIPTLAIALAVSFLAAPMIVAKDQGSFRAISDAWQVLKQNFWLFLLVSFIGLVIVMVIAFFLGAASGIIDQVFHLPDVVTTPIASLISAVLIGPWNAILQSVVYHRLTQGAEGVFTGPVQVGTLPPPYAGSIPPAVQEEELETGDDSREDDEHGDTAR